MTLPLTPEADLLIDCQDWLLTDDGQCHALNLTPLDLPDTPYRLYRFLTEVDDVLAVTPDDESRVRAIAPLARKLLTSSYWLQFDYSDPNPKTGWSVRFLYREQGYALTVQMVAWLPGHRSPIHNHATWGLVAVVSGEEKNQFWRRSPTPDTPNRIELVDEKLLVPGDILGFTAGAIHAVEPQGDEPVITFNLYGVTDYSQRYEFDPATHTAKNF